MYASNLEQYLQQPTECWENFQRDGARLLKVISSSAGSLITAAMKNASASLSAPSAASVAFPEAEAVPEEPGSVSCSRSISVNAKKS
jgi:hypothetical protein